jgi:hypothetical protein
MGFYGCYPFYAQVLRKAKIGSISLNIGGFPLHSIRFRDFYGSCKAVLVHDGSKTQTPNTYLDHNDFSKGESKYVKAFEKIGKHLSTGAQVLFTACNAGLDKNLAQSIFNRLGGQEKNLTLYLNKSGTAFPPGIDEPLTSRQWQPWTMTTRNGTSDLPIGKDLFLYNRGSIRRGSSSDSKRAKEKVGPEFIGSAGQAGVDF